jgi:hypothetical protein
MSVIIIVVIIIIIIITGGGGSFSGSGRPYTIVWNTVIVFLQGMRQFRT